MPKGGDLHNHLSGAIYAESYLRWAAEDGLCLATATMTIVGGTCDASADRPAVSAVLQNATLYSQAIDAMSMRNRNPASNGHDHFFASFSRFNLPSNSRTGDMLAEVASRAAAEHVSYLELMITPDGGTASRRGRAAGWDADLGRQRDKLLAAGFRDAVVGEVRKQLDAAEARRNELLACGTPKADPGCLVTIRYISQVARAGPPEAVFAQILGGFEAATADPRVVSFNLVQPEDNPTAVRDFSLHMSMIDFLHAQYPRVPIALHADELAPGLVAPEAMRFHVRDSMRRGHARRIGHATGVMHEDAALDLLREMAAEEGAGGSCAEQRRSDSGRERQSSPAAHVAGVRRARRDRHRRHGRLAIDAHAGIHEGGRGTGSGLQDDEGAGPELDRVLVRGSGHQNAVEDGSREGVPRF